MTNKKQSNQTCDDRPHGGAPLQKSDSCNQKPDDNKWDDRV